MLKNNLLKKKLESGKSVLGTWNVIASPELVDIIASSGLDFIILDGEHGPLGHETAQKMIIACENNNVTPIVRVGEIDELNILRNLDIGAHGIQIPNVESVDDIYKIIKFSKYPPLGNRGFSPFTRAGNYSLGNAKELFQTANKSTLLIINIESKKAFENIDEILQVPDIDVVYIGLYDLSKSLGIPGEINSPLVQEKLADVVYKILKAGKIAGTIATTEIDLLKFKNMGIKYLAYLADCHVVKSAYMKIVEQYV